MTTHMRSRDRRAAGRPPLAIELAAAPCPHPVAVRTAGASGAPPAAALQRGDRPAFAPANAALDDQLELRATQPGRQRLFRHISIFAGEVSLEAAEYIGRGLRIGPETSDVHADDPAIAVLDWLTTLVSQSLLRVLDTQPEDLEPDSLRMPASTRYGMLETIREFGFEMLVATDETAAAGRVMPPGASSSRSAPSRC